MRPEPAPLWNTPRGRTLVLAVCVAVAVAACVLRAWGVTQHFWLMQDQIRDWDVALHPLWNLPLVGPPTHVGGYTIGPAFYWIFWGIRVVLGPWFHNLPHAGGIAQAALGSAADALLLAAIWKRTGSLGLALAAVVVLVTAPYDLSLAATIWNPIIGATLATTALALVVLGWSGASLLRVVVTAAVAWCAVHAYTGAVYVALGVFAALVADQLARREWRRAAVRAGAIVAVVAALQVPYAVYQLEHRADVGGMDAVKGSVEQVVTGAQSTRFGESAAFYLLAVTWVEAGGRPIPGAAWILILGGILTAVRFRRTPSVVVAVLLPQVLAIVGYGLWLADLQQYYYLSLMPAAVLTVTLGLSALAPRRTGALVGVIACVLAFLITGPRVRDGHQYEFPAYAALVRGSEAIRSMGQPMRAIGTSFPMPPASDSSFLYEVLGGTLDRTSRWVAIIQTDGQVEYRQLPPG